MRFNAAVGLPPQQHDGAPIHQAACAGLARVLAKGMPEWLPVLEVQLPSGGAAALDCRLAEGKAAVLLREQASLRGEAHQVQRG